ncbi:MAG: hypothetical protein UX38_C0003G0041 [Microgenomates group bacterium GW2011_GWC1_46_16]|uniref:Uncharacterized protein n=2 Tax=Candidatus Collieribacteriota TaxID=1752725 RepID=A0A1F5G0M8_9BACT|nr:MAG: hypothetical protein UX32_C0002G0046 [Microgenomates group bacterium GW2011_GWF1_46_12]KKU26776.1 MAG: hypothetical protein UX38_C0003G0041 [Microgenomates group bacterium GW2011_GWC1_46_16]KKU28010.1 MAG: hypothetical protein UX40_C0004G0040 [Microgenomates group bacterium GW2011_GWF2_46_18]KKU44245.1 MAG: hypothetical protein UX59_C0002G0031 [Microgenomates group bacterium GW2011_GWA1_46_7]KKU45684.1 MAG: hypothetical protein UX63_C0002G0045 [Microgenomates group bacterium GW2011_GWB1
MKKKIKGKQSRNVRSGLLMIMSVGLAIMTAITVGWMIWEANYIDKNVLEYQDREVEEEDVVVANVGITNEEMVSVNAVSPSDEYATYCLGPDYNPEMETGWGSNQNNLVACGSSEATKGSCVMANLSTPRKEVYSCQVIRNPAKGSAQQISLLRDYGVDTSTVTEAGCKLEARLQLSWSKALIGPKCQPGLLYNQRSVTSNVMMDKHTGASAPKPIDISRMHKCQPGLYGRKHPVVYKNGEKIHLDPGHPDKNWIVSGKGLQKQIDAYRGQGYDVKWEEYYVPIKGVCECRTERPLNMMSGDKLIKVCAKTGPAQVKLVGSTLCYNKSNQVQFCCPAGKTNQNGECK